jgi:hypothetical protein
MIKAHSRKREGGDIAAFSCGEFEVPIGIAASS